MKHWKIIYKWLKKHLMIQKKERKDWNGMKERKDWNEMKERKDWKKENIEMISLEVFPKVDVTASSVVEVLR